MMNRSTQRELIKLLLQFSETLPQIDFGADEQKNMALDILETVAGKCRQDFSKVKADEYTDTMQALSQIIQTTDWHQQGRAENIQCNTLCQDIILQLVENLRHEQEIKKDIVFLPYKASMWDSLESVWKAAYEDKEHCNAYVIPIPYADLNPDRSVAAWHCERDQYPKYVPTLDWREIDLEKWHPDIIFIHNPYDNYNYITSVESRYYAQNLKHCTNKLVYIPYFVLEEPCTEESVENFVMTAGVLNADKIVVQSEAMRELYINILTKKTEHTDRVYWEKRISGAGSPKIEKVLTSKKEDFEMPEKWRKLVEGKKVILYNTSLSAMLQNSDKVCDKLRYVFDVFRNRDDVVLWWRPHPLMKSTFHSMRPQYEEEYLSLEKQYIEEGWGIYDDSSDLHRAICWSDAYYGDLSSVITLFKKTDKLIMIEDMNKGNNGTYLRFISFIVEKDIIYFVLANYSYNIPCLVKFDLIDGKAEILCELPHSKDGMLEYLTVGKINNKIVVAPYHSNEYFLVYDIADRTKVNIPVETEIWREKQDCVISAFGNVVKWNQSLYFIGNGNDLIVEYRYSKNSLIYHHGWMKGLLANHDINNIWFETDGVNMVGDCAYLIPIDKLYPIKPNLILKINLQTCTAEAIEINLPFHIRNMTIANSKLYALPLAGQKIIEMELPIHIHRDYRTCEIAESSNRGFMRIVVWDSRPTLLPYLARRIVILSDEPCVYEDEINGLVIEAGQSYDSSGFECVTYDAENKRWLARNSNGYLLELSEINHGCKVHDLKMDLNFKKYIVDIIKEDLHGDVSDIFNINEMIDYSSNKRPNRMYMSCGEKIYNEVVN